MKNYRDLEVWEKAHDLTLARDLGLLDSGAYTVLADKLSEVRKMLNVFIHKLKVQSSNHLSHSSLPTDPGSP